MSWIILIVAGVFETFWAYQLKLSEGFSNIIPTLLTIAGMLVSFILLAQALKSIPLSIGYAAWTGIGIIGTALLGFTLLNEQFSIGKVFFIALIAVGIIGLNMTSPE